MSPEKKVLRAVQHVGGLELCPTATKSLLVLSDYRHYLDV